MLLDMHWIIQPALPWLCLLAVCQPMQTAREIWSPRLKSDCGLLLSENLLGYGFFSAENRWQIDYLVGKDPVEI